MTTTSVADAPSAPNRLSNTAPSGEKNGMMALVAMRNQPTPIAEVHTPRRRSPNMKNTRMPIMATTRATSSFQMSASAMHHQ